jgi:hypothetical protein
MFENWVLKKIFGPERREQLKDGENPIVGNLIIYIRQQKCFCNQVKENELAGRGM